MRRALRRSRDPSNPPSPQNPSSIHSPTAPESTQLTSLTGSSSLSPPPVNKHAYPGPSPSPSPSIVASSFPESQPIPGGYGYPYGVGSAAGFGGQDLYTTLGMDKAYSGYNSGYKQSEEEEEVQPSEKMAPTPSPGAVLAPASSPDIPFPFRSESTSSLNLNNNNDSQAQPENLDNTVPDSQQQSSTQKSTSASQGVFKVPQRPPPVPHPHPHRDERGQKQHPGIALPHDIRNVRNNLANTGRAGSSSQFQPRANHSQYNYPHAISSTSTNSSSGISSDSSSFLVPKAMYQGAGRGGNEGVMKKFLDASKERYSGAGVRDVMDKGKQTQKSAALEGDTGRGSPVAGAAETVGEQVEEQMTTVPERYPPLLAGLRIHLLPLKFGAEIAMVRKKIHTLGGILVDLPILPKGDMEDNEAGAETMGMDQGGTASRWDAPEFRPPPTYEVPREVAAGPHILLTALKGSARLVLNIGSLLGGGIQSDGEERDEWGLLECVNVAWLDEVWKVAEGWVEENRISLSKAKDEPEDILAGGADALPDDVEDSVFQATYTSQSPNRPKPPIFTPFPPLPPRAEFRIPHTSHAAFKRERNRDSLAVCSPPMYSWMKSAEEGMAGILVEDWRLDGEVDVTPGKRSVPAEEEARDVKAKGRMSERLKRKMTNAEEPVAKRTRQHDTKLAKIEDRAAVKVKLEQQSEVNNMAVDVKPDFQPLSPPIDQEAKPTYLNLLDLLLKPPEKTASYAQDALIEEAKSIPPPEKQYSKDLQPFSVDTPFNLIPSLAIRRCSPLYCPNDAFVEAIRPIWQKREFDAPEEKNANTLSYRRSMSVLKAVPIKVSSGKEALKLPDLGEKVAQRIDEFVETGRLEESENILADPRFQTLRLFASVFTIGSSKAVELYDLQGCRSLTDVAEYYAEREGREWDTGIVGEGTPLTKRMIKYDPTGVLGKLAVWKLKRRSRDAAKRRRDGTMSKAEVVREWMLIQDELDQKIPRAEVTEIAACVQQHLDAILPGCHCTLTGGYRRGKRESNDVDVVISPPAPGLEGGLLRALRTRLASYGIITHVLQLTAAVDQEKTSHNNNRGNNFDGLDKAFIIFRLPGGPDNKPRCHRRVDLILSSYHRYALGVLGWSGSMCIERDLRRHVENNLGLKFDSGSLHDRRTGQEIYARTERDIFRLLGLTYIPPFYRNADG